MTLTTLPQPARLHRFLQLLDEASADCDRVERYKAGLAANAKPHPSDQFYSARAKLAKLFPPDDPLDGTPLGTVAQHDNNSAEPCRSAGKVIDFCARLNKKREIESSQDDPADPLVIARLLSESARSHLHPRFRVPLPNQDALMPRPRSKALGRPAE